MEGTEVMEELEHSEEKQGDTAGSEFEALPDNQKHWSLSSATFINHFASVLFMGGAEVFEHSDPE